ncbi:class II aldolase/adducin family protein [Nocardia anaemiae]|uniref:class II aldolase/adducin family protein n=1 Tax=Nocardia anaemiae TaxID=263910 RepID=UPI0007A4F057|nr:class II aldolase/adducin family protein [Nocardia anaemiae]
MISKDIQQVRAAVAEASRQLAGHDFVLGTAGNVSARVGDLVAVTASGIALAEATADDVTVVDLDGNHHAGHLRPTSEIEIHLGVYRSSHQLAVVHTHSPAAISVSLIASELPVIHYQQLLLGGAVPVVPFAAFGSEELASSTLAALRQKNAAILANHGSVTVGDSLETALDNAVLLEWSSRIYLDAAAVGAPRPLTDAQLQDVVQAAVRTGYGSTHPIGT